MINNINNIWKNALFAFCLLLFLSISVSYNFLSSGNEFSISDKVSIILYIILLIHFLIITLFIIINLILKKYLKAIGFLLMNIILGFSIYIFFLFIGAFSLGLGTYTDDYQRHNFRKSEVCSQINKAKLKADLEKISKRVYAKEFNKEFIESLKSNQKDLPNKIIKIECGCRQTDSTIIVFRIWDNNNETYELELEKENNKLNYKSYAPTTFEN